VSRQTHLWQRQIAAVFRLEWRKTLLSRRGWWIYLLAAGPVAICLLHALLTSRRAHPRHSLGNDVQAFAMMFQLFYLRGAIFFGCMGIFASLFRGEMLEKTLHYYYLTPLRRESLVAGKYLAGLLAACSLFVPSVAASLLLIGSHDHAYSDYLWRGPGLAQLGWYVLVTVLACVGYGAVFLACGLLFRNPMIPAAAVYVWENVNPFLPSLLQKISVISYLKGLCPVEVPLPPPLNVIVVDIDPTPVWIAVPGLLAVAALLVTYTAIAARRGEISYGE
jgi:ABC-type transport system involved in multi-copper enzyme maturation permease subunit